MKHFLRPDKGVVLILVELSLTFFSRIPQQDRSQQSWWLFVCILRLVFSLWRCACNHLFQDKLQVLCQYSIYRVEHCYQPWLWHHRLVHYVFPPAKPSLSLGLVSAPMLPEWVRNLLDKFHAVSRVFFVIGWALRNFRCCTSQEHVVRV